MNRFAVSIACIGLAGCSSLGSNAGLTTGSTGYPIKLESDPPGADARTSIGPGCQTPCTAMVPARGDFTVAFSLAGRETQTIPVQLQATGDAGTVQFAPNPVFAALEPAPPAREAKKKPAKAKPRTASKPGTGGGTAPLPEVPPDQRTIPGALPTTPPAAAWPPAR
jgi:hypothetical protein